MQTISPPPIASLRLDGGTQPRSQIDLFTVRDYADAMRDGSRFPPVTAFFDGTDYWLADGFHRVAAAKDAGVEIAVDVREGSRREAVLHSVGANSTHGLRRTNEDKRRAVMVLLEDPEWAKWSDREIARRTGVHHQMVAKLREPLDESSSERVYTDRYGNERVMDTSNIGVVPPPPPTEPTMSWTPTPDQYDEEPPRPNHLNILSQESVEWYTPPEYIEAAREVMGGIDLDPASNEVAQGVINASTHYTKDDDGLAYPWRGRMWLNPPYGRACAEFVAKAVREFEAGNVPQAILLLNSNSNETEWFQPLWNYTLCFTRGRINYYTPSGEPGAGSTHGSVFVYLGSDWQPFASRFGEYGNVVRRVT